MAARQNMLTAAAVAPIIHKKQSTLAKYRSIGKGPPWQKVEGTPLYPEDDLYAWLEAQPKHLPISTRILPAHDNGNGNHHRRSA